jgi:DNA repair exonuclease SbcCD ATPase subunit
MFELSDTINRKFINSFELSDWEIDTDTGWKQISHIHKTIEYSEWIITTSSGKELICADDHIIFDENMKQIFVKDCVPNITRIQTRDGVELVVSVTNTGNYSNMYDVSVNDVNHRFWSGDILSHNSSFLDALTFVLYGKPFRKINKPQLINSTNNSDLLVEINFKINKDSYLIRRGMKPNIFEIFTNNKLIDQNAISRDYQELLENHILKMNYKTFTQIVVIGNATYMPFMKLNPVDRRNIVENLLDIDIFSKMNSLLKTKVSKTKEEINGTSYKLDLSKEKMKIHKNLISNSTSDIDKSITDIDAEMRRNELQVIAKELAIDKLNNEIQEIIVNDSKISTLTSKLSNLTHYSVTFKEKMKNLSKEIKFFNTNDSCPTCTQSIPEEFKSTTLSSKEKELTKYNDAISSCNSEINSISIEIEEINKNIEEIKERKTEITKRQFEIDSITQYIGKLSKQINDLRVKKIEDVKKIEEEKTILEQELETLNEERDTLLNQQHLQSIAAILLKDDGIKTKIIRHYLPVMNKIINKYLQLMDFYVNFSLDENFDEVIKNKSKENFTYHSFSEGEKLRIDLAILFTWREISKMKNAANTNLLILDEILDSSLDALGIDDFLKILSSSKEQTNTFVISHRSDGIQDKFERIYRFSKVNGFTKISID